MTALKKVPTSIRPRILAQASVGVGRKGVGDGCVGVGKGVKLGTAVKVGEGARVGGMDVGV